MQSVNNNYSSPPRPRALYKMFNRNVRSSANPARFCNCIAYAAAVGYSSESIQVIASRSAGQGISPSDYFLVEWSRRNPTIHAFVKILKDNHMWRVLELIRPYVPDKLYRDAQSEMTLSYTNYSNNPPTPTAPPLTPVIPMCAQFRRMTLDQREAHESVPHVYRENPGPPAAQRPQFPVQESCGHVGPSEDLSYMETVSMRRSSVNRQIRDEEAATFNTLVPAQRDCSPQSISDDSSLGISFLHFSYKEIANGTKNWSDCLGRGSFGEVYMAKIRNTDFAVKRFYPPVTARRGTRPEPRIEKIHRNEMLALSRIRHDNVIQLIGYSVDEDVCLVYEYMANGSLYNRLHDLTDRPALEWHSRLSILTDTARGLQYLHTIDSKQPLIHGAVTSSNILLDASQRAKISDFGLAQIADKSSSGHSECTHVTQTSHCTDFNAAYLAPESLDGKRLSVKMDIFAYGVVVCEVCTGLKADDPKRSRDHRFLHRLVHEYAVAGSALRLKDAKRSDGPDALVQALFDIGVRCAAYQPRRPMMTTIHTELEALRTRYENDLEALCRQAVSSPVPVVGYPMFLSASGGVPDPRLFGESPLSYDEPYQTCDPIVQHSRDDYLPPLVEFADNGCTIYAAGSSDDNWPDCERNCSIPVSNGRVELPEEYCDRGTMQRTLSHPNDNHYRMENFCLNRSLSYPANSNQNHLVLTQLISVNTDITSASNGSRVPSESGLNTPMSDTNNLSDQNAAVSEHRSITETCCQGDEEEAMRVKRAGGLPAGMKSLFSLGI